MKRLHSWNKLLLIFLALILAVVTIYVVRSSLFNWPGLAVILEVALIILIWYKYPAVRKIIGEDKPRERTATGRALDVLCWVLLPLFVVSFTFYFLVSDLYSSVPSVAQFSIIAVTATLGALVLTAASNLRKNKKRSELINVSQKFISATVLFIIFVPSLLMIELLNGIDINCITLSSLGDPIAWGRGIYFWLLVVPPFYIGMALFLWALKDLVIALMDIDE